MELNRYASVISRWWWLWVLSCGLAAIATVQNSSNAVPMYRATSTVLVGQFLNSDNPQPQDFTISQQLAQYYAQQVRRQSILQATVAALELDRPWSSLTGQVNAVAASGSQSIQITVVDPVPDDARRIADEIAAQLIRHSPTPSDAEQDAQRQFVAGQLSTLQARIAEAQSNIQELQQQLVNENSALRIRDIQTQITTLQDKVSTWQTLYTNLLGWQRGSRTNYLSILDPAVVSTAPVASSQLDLLLPIAIAGMLALAASFLLEALDDRLRSRQEAGRVLKLPVLGTIPAPGDPSGAGQSPSQLPEAYRLLRTNVQIALAKTDARLLLVAGVDGQEDGTSIAAALAESCARSGRKIILVDANSFRPSVHTAFRVANDMGLTALLQGESRQRMEERSDAAEGRPEVGRQTLRHRLQAALQPAAIPGLRLLPYGAGGSGSLDLVDSREMSSLLEEMAGMADLVILNGPPVTAGADAAILAAKGASVLLVVTEGRTRRPRALAARESFPSSADILGIVWSESAHRLSIGSETLFRGAHRILRAAAAGGRTLERPRIAPPSADNPASQGELSS